MKMIMNTQEMRRLGILPYEEDEVRSTWHSGVVRTRLTELPHLGNDEIDEMRQELDDEIDRSLAEDFEEEPEPRTFIQAMRRYFRRNNGN
jgi:hypothetical protein